MCEELLGPNWNDEIMSKNFEPHEINMRDLMGI
jgi:hypothetical protein